MKIASFKELDCWKKGRELVRNTYGLTKTSPFSNDFGLRDQIQRAAVSVMANVAEGFGTATDKEFVRYLSMAIRSASEVQSHLCAALDLGYIDADKYGAVDGVAADCINLCKGLVRYLSQKG